MKMRHSKCVVNIQLPEHRGDKFKGLLDPMLRYFDPASICVKLTDVHEVLKHVKSPSTIQNGPPNTRYHDNSGIPDDKGIPRYHDVRGLLSTPALAIMLFLQERGFCSAQEVQKYFVKFPWRVHHKIELENKRTPGIKIARQEFYMLSREYPLWCVCPVYAGYEHLRINLFVSKYSEMVEFYRLVTDSEMESTKKDFCLFPLSTEGNLQVMLCLKRCKQLKPYPLTKAHLSIQVKSFSVLKQVLKCEFKEISPNKYFTRDPDGNEVMLEDNCATPGKTAFHDVRKLADDVICDITSVKSVCGSHDSGRYSDSDPCSSIPESKGVKKVVHFSDTSDDVTWFYMTDGLSPLDFQYDEREEFLLRESALRCDELYPSELPDHTNPPLHRGASDQPDVSVSRKSDNRLPILTVTDCFGDVHNVTKTNEQTSYAYHGQILVEEGLDSTKVKSPPGDKFKKYSHSPERRSDESEIPSKNVKIPVLENQTRTASVSGCCRQDKESDLRRLSSDRVDLSSDCRSAVTSERYLPRTWNAQANGKSTIPDSYNNVGEINHVTGRHLASLNQEWPRTNLSDSEDLNNEKEYAERLREEIKKKRQVEPVYI